MMYGSASPSQSVAEVRVITLNATFALLVCSVAYF